METLTRQQLVQAHVIFSAEKMSFARAAALRKA
jgi:hypothetical protein